MVRKKQHKRGPRVTPATRQDAKPSAGVPVPTHSVPVQDGLAPTNMEEPLGEKIFHWGEKGSLALLGAGCLVLFQNVVTQMQASPSQLQEVMGRNALVVCMAFLLLILGACSLWRRRRFKRAAKKGPRQQVLISQPAPTKGGTTREWRRVLAQVLFSPVFSITSTVFFLALLVLVLIRPTWCPGLICPPAQTTIATHPGGSHDQNLDAYFLTAQSNFFALPGNLQHYTLGNLPQRVGAMRSDNVSAIPYGLVIGVQNLHQAGAGNTIYIDGVVVVVQALPALDDPLHVWHASSLVYTTAPYLLTYAGQPPGSQMTASYQPFPRVTGVRQRVGVSESDDIDLQIIPAQNLHADLKFQVKILYSVATQNGGGSLTLPNQFEVVFSTADNWHVQTF